MRDEATSAEQLAEAIRPYVSALLRVIVAELRAGEASSWRATPIDELARRRAEWWEARGFSADAPGPWNDRPAPRTSRGDADAHGHVA
jgi:hypothetical protein